MMPELLINYIRDPRNGETNYTMGMAYLQIGHFAGAISHFLRCAEYSNIEGEKDLIYASLINISLCLNVLKNRDQLEKGWLL